MSCFLSLQSLHLFLRLLPDILLLLDLTLQIIDLSVQIASLVVHRLLMALKVLDHLLQLPDLSLGSLHLLASFHFGGRDFLVDGVQALAQMLDHLILLAARILCCRQGIAQCLKFQQHLGLLLLHFRYLLFQLQYMGSVFLLPACLTPHLPALLFGGAKVLFQLQQFSLKLGMGCPQILHGPVLLLQNMVLCMQPFSRSTHFTDSKLLLLHFPF
mmetsp:Transcript_10057/g.17764  ORF Transcript_10057/g.17764 Transcript_10057/m.17764 type:complete len:214 (+) Transcript_10057:1616-2257(+)